jgi:hypothetical protein
MDQEEEFTSRKTSRSHIFIENKTKEEKFTVKIRTINCEGEGAKMATQAKNLNPQWRIWSLEARICAKLASGEFGPNSQWWNCDKLAKQVEDQSARPHG